ncbi:MAG TPA: GGDEF domain-containing protein [Solirubrobacteraceae bacterium]|nr:GGDEF domain-containing protein [Solirubrobacteraceae bacterium]
MRRSNGNIEGQQERAARAADLLGSEQTLADTDQTLADTDQTLADADQTGSDSDQATSDSDQRAAEYDQAAADRDLVDGVNPRSHEFSRDVRLRTARRREQAAAARLETADQRDAGARARDVAAFERDHAAAARDLAMAQRDHAAAGEFESRAITGADVVLRAADQRRRAARQRVEAAEHRALAAGDRRAALYDREQAARDRQQALTDREALARQLAIAETDALTGARTRAAGLVELEHELARCRRNGGTLVVSYVDVVGLKTLNDSRGHAAGDELLKRVVALLRSQMRSYDLIIRLGGDEFLCVMSNMALHDARERFGAASSTLSASAEVGEIRTGLAQLTDSDTVEDLIARADSELLANRG